MAHGNAFRIADAAQRGCGKDTGQDTAHDTADTVYAEHIARVINTQPAFENRYPPQTRQAGGETHNQ